MPHVALGLDAYTGFHLDHLKSPIAHPMVDLRLPIIALVDLHATRRSPGIPGRVFSHGPLKCCPPRNNVRVARNCSGGDNRVGLLDCQWETTECEFIGSCWVSNAGG